MSNIDVLPTSQHPSIVHLLTYDTDINQNQPISTVTDIYGRGIHSLMLICIAMTSWMPCMMSSVTEKEVFC